MNQIKISIIALFFSVLAVALPAQANDSHDAAKQMVALFNATDSYQASFEQLVSNNLGLTMQELRGVIALRKPKQFRWQVDFPYEQIIFSTEDTVSVFDVDLDQVIIRKMDQQLGNTPALLFSGDAEQISSAFTVVVERDMEADKRFHLVPNNEDAMFQEMRVSFIDGILKDLFLLDNLGQQTVITFSDQQTNIELDDALFSPTFPDYVDVIEDF